MSDCDILRPSRFWNITCHDCENNHDYKILAIFDEKLMQQIISYDVFYGLCALGNYVLPSNNMDDIVNIKSSMHRITYGSAKISP